MFGKFGQKFYLLIEQRSHTVRHVLLMRPVDRHALLAVAVLATGLFTGAVILSLKFRCELLLQPESFFAVSLMKFFHSVKFFLISLDDHLILFPS